MRRRLHDRSHAPFGVHDIHDVNDALLLQPEGRGDELWRGRPERVWRTDGGMDELVALRVLDAFCGGIYDFDSRYLDSVGATVFGAVEVGVAQKG